MSSPANIQEPGTRNQEPGTKNKEPGTKNKEPGARNSKVHLPFLDGIRGIAMLGVFLFHSLSASFGFDKFQWKGLFLDFDTSWSFLALFPFTYGSAGVAVFFVVSGFCIHLSYQRSKEKGWLSFANKRLFRIYPPYLLAICLFFFVWPWGSFDLNSFHRFAQLFAHVFAIHNFDQRTYFGINPSFWSIAVEIQLYAIYPLLLILTSKLGWKHTLLIIGGLEVVLRLLPSVNGLYAGPPIPRFISSSPFAYWFSWSIGAYLCECFMTNRASNLFRLRFDLMILIALGVPLFKPTAPLTFLAFALLTAIAIERLMTQKWVLPDNRLFKTLWAHLSFLGITSYSFYLFHQPIMGLNERVFVKFFAETSIHPLLKYLACLAWYPIILFLSHILYRLIERPSTRLREKTWLRIKKAQDARSIR